MGSTIIQRTDSGTLSVPNTAAVASIKVAPKGKLAWATRQEFTTWADAPRLMARAYGAPSSNPKSNTTAA